MFDRLDISTASKYLPFLLAVRALPRNRIGPAVGMQDEVNGHPYIGGNALNADNFQVRGDKLVTHALK